MPAVDVQTLLLMGVLNRIRQIEQMLQENANRLPRPRRPALTKTSSPASSPLEKLIFEDQ